jgi:hypothetical protein
MSQSLRCPNPICTHVFGAAELAGVASASCPRCGMVVQFRTLAAPPAASGTAATIALPTAPPAGVPMAQPVKAVPLARPVAPSPPMASAAFQSARPAPPPIPPVAENRGPIVRARHLSRSRDWLTYPIAFGVFLLLCALGVVGYLVSQRGTLDSRTRDGGFKNSDYNFAFDPKNAKWQESVELKNKLGVSQLALKHSEPSGFFAVDVIDYHDHNPTPRELDDEARKKLKDWFPKNVETEPLKDAPPQTADRIAGQITYRIVFEGQSEEETASGEVDFFANQGLGYWLYTWAPTASAKDLASDFKAFRKNFTLMGERAAWKQIQQHRQEYEGDAVKGYRLIDASGRWRKEDDPKAHDDKADLVLHADPPKPGLPTQGADVVVMSLPPGKDPVEQATEHIIQKHVRERYPDTRIEEAYVAGDGPKDHVGDAKGHLLQWRINNGPGRERFAIVGIIPRSGDTLVLYGECDMARRVTWETLIRQLIESVQIKE